KNQPGALANVCETLAAEHINIEYAYCSSGGRNGKVFGIFKVSNLDKAQKVLGAGNNRRLERRPLRDQRAYKKAQGGYGVHERRDLRCLPASGGWIVPISLFTLLGFSSTMTVLISTRFCNPLAPAALWIGGMRGNCPSSRIDRIGCSFRPSR